MSVTAYSVSEGVALLQLDRPEARNAINTEMLDELLAHLTEARADEEVRALVISSTDHMGLSAGADVRERLEPEAGVRRMELFALLYDELTAFPKPTVAACHGACVGGGAEIAVCCDLRVGGGNLRLRFPGGALGVPVGPGAAGHPLRALGRQVPAADREGGRRRHGLPLGPGAQGRSGRRAPRRRRCSSPPRWPSTRPRRSRG